MYPAHSTTMRLSRPLELAVMKRLSAWLSVTTHNSLGILLKELVIESLLPMSPRTL
jgi:hypothetical protein